MPRKRANTQPGAPSGALRAPTPNQVVAYNLARARQLRGWTQEEAAAALEPWLGVLWSRATFSQAERSVAGKVIRNFTADEIVAFAGAFGLPPAWFFSPVPRGAEPGRDIHVRLNGSEPGDQLAQTG